MKPNILVVDDEQHIREQMMRFLLQQDYHVFGAAYADEAYEVLDSQSVDLAIVDIMMPGQDGFQLCEEIKSSYQKPVIMVTARSELNDKRKAFEAGTDDYVTKPFNLEELLFRIRAVLSRYQKTQRPIIIGNVLVSPETNEVEVDGQLLYFPNKEFELLYMLFTHHPNVVTREQLLENIWGFDFDGDERTIDVHVKRIRKRLSAFETAIEIMTVRGIGYKVHHV